MNNTPKVNAVVVGATGYGGAEILRSLLRHPNVSILRTTAIDHVGKKLSQVHFSLTGKNDLIIEELPIEEAAKGADVVLLALPHLVSCRLIPTLVDLGVRIVDMSGDFRLNDKNVYQQYYGEEHPRPDLLTPFVYGLPELSREQIKATRFVASPGCFATGSELALLPFAKGGLLSGKIKIVACTGSSGGGALPKPAAHHPIRSQNLRTYNPLTHRHIPEILQTLNEAGADNITIKFIPISAPLTRGILVSAFIEVAPEITEAQISELYENTYGNETFVRIVNNRFPEVVAVKGTNYAEVGFQLDNDTSSGTKTVAAFCALDNLIKGGGGQAVQNMNIMLGLDEGIALESPGLWP